MADAFEKTGTAVESAGERNNSAAAAARPAPSTPLPELLLRRELLALPLTAKPSSPVNVAQVRAHESQCRHDFLDLIWALFIFLLGAER